MATRGVMQRQLFTLLYNRLTLNCVTRNTSFSNCEKTVLLNSRWRYFRSCVPSDRSNISAHVLSGRGLHFSAINNGLDEFFQKGEDLIEEAEKTGRAWQARELRSKSSEDLHKLWYVLLKERNMLLTLSHNAKRNGFLMPGPERIKKVRQSMARIKLVIGERNRAVREARVNLRDQTCDEELKSTG